MKAASFDVVEATGVLHHLADPVAGLKVLVAMLRPRGLLKLALYSKAKHLHFTLDAEVSASLMSGCTCSSGCSPEVCRREWLSGQYSGMLILITWMNFLCANTQGSASGIRAFRRHVLSLQEEHPVAQANML